MAPWRLRMGRSPLVLARLMKTSSSANAEARKLSDAYVEGKSSIDDLRSSYTVREKRLESYVVAHNLEVGRGAPA
eukprot:scaffold7881_cov258-Pinguiococcus_pyrenoidosus.AAC.4